MAILLAFAASNLLPVNAAPESPAQGLPPRPTLTPTATPPTPTPQPTTRRQKARIQLVAPAYTGAWSVVQWQGADGTWHDVEGWQGTIDEGRKRWVVLPKDYGPGSPYRWVILAEKSGPVLAVSEEFDLPGADGELIEVPVGPQ